MDSIQRFYCFRTVNKKNQAVNLAIDVISHLLNGQNSQNSIIPFLKLQFSARVFYLIFRALRNSVNIVSLKISPIIKNIWSRINATDRSSQKVKIIRRKFHFAYRFGTKILRIKWDRNSLFYILPQDKNLSFAQQKNKLNQLNENN